MSAEYDPLAATSNPRTWLPLIIEEIAMALAMAAMALITLANVLTRYLTNASLAFTEEYSVLLMVVVAMLGTSYAMAGGRHIRIGYFADSLPEHLRRPLAMVAMGLVILCFGILVFYGARLAWDEYRFEVMTPGLGNPQWLYSGLLPLLSLFVIGRAFGRMIRIHRGEDT